MKVDVTSNPACPCGEPYQTRTHILRDCQFAGCGIEMLSPKKKTLSRRAMSTPVSRPPGTLRCRSLFNENKNIIPRRLIKVTSKVPLVSLLSQWPSTV